jgi:hypothetical protein
MILSNFDLLFNLKLFIISFLNNYVNLSHIYIANNYLLCITYCNISLDFNESLIFLSRNNSYKYL